MTHDHLATPTSTDDFPIAVAQRVNRGARFRGLLARDEAGATRLTAVTAEGAALNLDELVVPAGGSYRSLSAQIPSARWYEREIHDLFGVTPVGHSLDPLIFPFQRGSELPRPGSGTQLAPAEPDLTPLPAHLRGEGVFTIPYGPVRSGVFESIEYLVETPGEDIPHLRTRVFYKHRGLKARFDGVDVGDGLLLAERVEGVASVAHALAFCGAVEQIEDLEVPHRAALVRVLHAELERIANHLDSTIRHTEAAGQAVAFARLSLHKERTQRLRALLCGNRFGRGVVVPGGVSSLPGLGASALRAAIDALEGPMRADIDLLLNTPSFLDRLRGTGTLPTSFVTQFAPLGPVARGSGLDDDVRLTRPYGAYGQLGLQALGANLNGDALSRQRVRVHEMWGSFHLIRQAIDGIELDAGSIADDGDPERERAGEAIGWAEAPQGEVLYLVGIRDGVLAHASPRSASFHNLGLFPSAFTGDILTDFAFIEASFGLSIAGVAA
jgi:Ni,Fe-hydrogenase III large subunit